MKSNYILKTIKQFSKLLLFATFIIIIAYFFFPELKLPQNIIVDKILVEKSKRKMNVFSKGEKLKTYTISLGFQPIGKKQFEGDGKTPEGKYFIVSKNNHSIAFKSLGISYPNADNRKFAARYRKSSGGNIMIHGMMNNFWYWGKFHRFIDWTGGCIALTNNEMEDLFKHVNIGCEIEIVE